MNALRSPQAAQRICFQGVEQSSPFGVLLRSSVSELATVSAHGRAGFAPKQWMATLLGTSLQWWEAEQPLSASTPNQRFADIAIDFFGSDPVRISAGRFWRVVDSNGEAILNPFCFLDACCRRPFVASVFLVESTVGESGWTIIGQAHISSCHWYRDLLDRVGHVAAHLVASALQKSEYVRAKAWHMTPNVRSRSRTQVAAGRLRAGLLKVAMTLRDMSFEEYWAIGVLTAPADSLVRSQVLTPDRWIRSPSRHTYLADPFPWPELSNIVLCERYDYRTGSGALRAITVADGNVVNEQVLDLQLGDAHLSYPFIFRDRGRIFLLPEMAAFGELILFELLSEAAARPVCVIEKGTRITDPTLFAHGGFYWIAYSDQGFGKHDNLCLLYASQLEGPWMPHPSNPVKVDIRCSRPGGTPFSLDGKLFRPAQDCSATYGGALVLNVVRVCTPTSYEEEPVAVLSADPHGHFPDGLHTLSIDGSRIIFDGKKLFLDPRRFWKRMKAHIQRSHRKPVH